MDDLTKLPNIGEVLAEKLSGIGVTNYEELAAVGSVEAVNRIGQTDISACYNMLYAIEGAIRGIRWHAIPKDERDTLRRRFDLCI
ncbi:MAG: competence protein TfoX [Anaerolineales bacterium]|nr:competence protein TfoX [Anaerolineales bacterium]